MLRFLAREDIRAINAYAAPSSLLLFKPQGDLGALVRPRPVRNATRTPLNTATADTRHSFAVSTLLTWYRAGANVQAGLPLLSTWLGHVNPASTYWYYSDSRVIPMPAPSCA